MVAETLLRQLSGIDPDPIGAAITQILPTIQAAQAQQRKAQFDELELKKRRAEAGKKERIQNIVSTSFIDGKFDTGFAAENLKKAGFIDVAQKIEAQQVGIDAGRQGIRGAKAQTKGVDARTRATEVGIEATKANMRAQLSGLKLEDIKRKDLEAKNIGEVFGSVLGASSENVEIAFEQALSSAIRFNTEFFDKIDLEQAEALQTVEEKLEFSRQFFFDAGTFSEQARILFAEKEVGIGGGAGGGSGNKVLSVDKLTSLQLQKIFLGQQEGKTVDQMLGDGTLVKAQLDLAMQKLGGADNLQASLKVAEIFPSFFRAVLKGDITALEEVGKIANVLKIQGLQSFKKQLDTGLKADRKAVSDSELRAIGITREFLGKVRKKGGISSDRDTLRLLINRQIKQQQGQ